MIFTLLFFSSYCNTLTLRKIGRFFNQRFKRHKGIIYLFLRSFLVFFRKPVETDFTVEQNSFQLK